MQRMTALILALAMASSVASAQKAPVAPIIQPQLPPECRERDADPEKCVINDGPPPSPIVRKKKPPSPPPPKPPPASQDRTGPRDAAKP
jgi:hypothetical protein